MCICTYAYMRNSISAQSIASTPPAPACMERRSIYVYICIYVYMCICVCVCVCVCAYT